MKEDYSIYKQKEIIKNIYTKTETALSKQQVADKNGVNEYYELLKSNYHSRSSSTSQEEPRNWMTPEIQNLLKEKKCTKHDSVEYKNLDKLIKSKCICAYEDFFDKKMR